MAPSRAARAVLAASRPSAAMRSITASARVRSIFPLTKARRVNSPGPAGTGPGLQSGPEDPLQQIQSAVTGQLRHVLSCIAVGSVKDQSDAFIDISPPGRRHARSGPYTRAVPSAIALSVGSGRSCPPPQGPPAPKVSRRLCLPPPGRWKWRRWWNSSVNTILSV